MQEQVHAVELSQGVLQIRPILEFRSNIQRIFFLRHVKLKSLFILEEKY